MKNYFLIALISIVSIWACQPSENFLANNQIDENTQFEWKYRIIRYLDHLPKRATDSTKFQSEFDEYYQKKASDLSFDLYHFDILSGRHYFSMSRDARSLHDKKVTTAGYWVENEEAELIEYVESYRTWKMKEVELREKSDYLFKKLIKGEDLSPYYNHNSKDEWIEFPDKNVAFNPEKRKWITAY